MPLDPENIYPVENLELALNWINVCSNASPVNSSNQKLESVSMYQTIDLLCEGEVEGLCDKHGNLVYLNRVPRKNENAFKGIYLNDVPIKNTDANTLNYNRVFADFKAGTERQTTLTKFKNPAISFSNAVQSLNLQVSLPGLGLMQQLINKSSKLFVTMAYDGSRVNLAGEWDNGHGDRHLAGAINGNFIHHISEYEGISLLRNIEKTQVICVAHTITNDNVNSVQIDMAVGALFYQSGKGDQMYAATNFVIKTGYVDDELTLSEGGSVIYLLGAITGKCTSSYVRSHLVPLPSGGPNKRDRIVKIFRVDNEVGPNNVRFQKSLQVQTISEIVQANLSYPHSALMGMLFDARAFSSPPTRRFDLKMTKVLVPSNYNAETRQYDGNWNGEFKIQKEWTDNPAWAFYDLATNERYGIGKFGFKDQFVDKWNLYSIAKYCDQFVPSGHTGKYANKDFTCTAGSVIITINDSSSLGADQFLEQFPEGETVCLFNTKNSSTQLLDKAFERLIFNPTYNTSNSSFSFKILKIPDSNLVFKKYPEVKDAFVEQTTNLSAFQFIKNYLIQNENSSSAFVSDYINGEPLDVDVTSGETVTQFETFRPVLEPRFKCNLYLDRKQNAFNALNDIAALFRGMIYWSAGYISLSNDQKREAVMLFTNANVLNGEFAYSGSSLTSRTTAVTVRFNDEFDSFKPKVEYLEDQAGLREYGYNEKEIVALGVTSRGQAHRLAKWMLYTVQTETDTIQFSTGQEASYLRPGDVIKIQDKLKTSKRYGGRIISIDYGAKELTLDEGIEENIVGEKITVIVPKASTTIRELNKEAENKLKIAVENQEPSEGISTQEIDESRQTQIKQFTIASVSETNVVTISETNNEDFNLISKGFIWSVQNTNTEYEIEEVEYRVIGVTEQNFNQYQVTGMMYNRTKFAAVDESQSVENTQQSKSAIVAVGALPAALTLDPDGDGVDDEAAAPIVSFIDFSADDIIPHFDAKFPVSTHVFKASEQLEYRNAYMAIDFSNLASINGVNKDNTGGYILEVFRSSGSKVRFSLAGHDNTTANILIGSVYDQNNVTYEIYRYDTSFKVDVGI